MASKYFADEPNNCVASSCHHCGSYNSGGYAIFSEILCISVLNPGTCVFFITSDFWRREG